MPTSRTRRTAAQRRADAAAHASEDQVEDDDNYTEDEGDDVEVQGEDVENPDAHEGDEPEPVEEAEKESPDVKVKDEKPSLVIKYMGSSDIRRLHSGENILGSLSDDDRLNTHLEWHAKDKHLLFADQYPDVPDAFWDQLLRLSDFRDVTEEYNDPSARIPVSSYDLMWRPQGTY